MFIKIYCCGCGKHVNARLTTGKEIYPHRDDLKSKHFYKCDKCKNYVGCHKDKKPFGCIPTNELRNARQCIHNKLDPLWKKKLIKRKDLYEKVSQMLGHEFHTAEIRSLKEARDIYSIVMIIRKELLSNRDDINYIQY